MFSVISRVFQVVFHVFCGLLEAFPCFAGFSMWISRFLWFMPAFSYACDK